MNAAFTTLALPLSAFLAASVAVESLVYADTAATIEDAGAPPAGSSITVEPFAYMMDGHCCSSPAILTGLDASYDRPLSSSLGLRARAGAVAFGIDEVEGWAPHLELGAVHRLPLGSRVRLETALLGGVEYGALDHKDSVDPAFGPTATVETALKIALGAHAVATVGGGYRLTWAQNDGDGPAHGATVRLGLGWTF